MSFRNLSMTTKIAKADLLTALRKNREEHADIVVEARAGYVEKAKAALLRKLDDIKSGKIVALMFKLSPPVDNTDVYDTVIKMVEMTTEEHIVLEATEFRNLIEDHWDWSRDFYHSNSLYSASATSKRQELGYDQ